MTIWQQIEEYILKIEHPAAKAGIEEIADFIDSEKATLVEKFGVAGVSAEVFLQSEVTSLVNAHPEAKIFLPFILPFFTEFIEKQIALGGAEIGTLIDATVAWLRKEEAFV